MKKLKELDGKRKDNSKEIKKLKSKLEEKASKTQIIDGQIEILEDVNKHEDETEGKINALL